MGLSTLASNPTGFHYVRDARQFGKSKFLVFGLFGLALDGIANHPTLPLRIATFFGLFIGMLTFLLALGYAVARLVFDYGIPDGFATMVILELLSISINALFLGIIGEYLSRIHQNIQRRPVATIQSAINLNRDQNAQT